jgi:two-component system invasion response regulator UvrY
VPQPPVPVPQMFSPADARLTSREFETAIMLAQGMTNAEIAQVLGIGQKTVDSHRGRVVDKLGARNNSDITRWAILHCLIDAGGNRLEEAPKP